MENDLFWLDESLPTPNRSAFEPFRDLDRHINGSKNMIKRVIGFLRTRPAISGSNRAETELERERSFRHMMNERARREKQKQSYSALHSILPMGTKNDKNSIICTALAKIGEMKGCRERLRQRKAELEAILADQTGSYERANWTVVRVRVANPTSGVDSMVEVLSCLKRLGLKTRKIRSVFAGHELSTELEIETEVKAAEIEEAIQLALYEAELKLRSHF